MILFTLVREATRPVLGGESFTPGKLYKDNAYFSETCEDEDRFLEDGKEEKVYARTAIPRGRRRLIASHSAHFDKVLPELLDVPGFSGVRMHGGNRAEDSEGCILVGRMRTATGIAQCAVTVERLVTILEDAADIGEPVFLEIT